MTILLSQSAAADVAAQFRYYETDEGLPEVAARFREAVYVSLAFLRDTPKAGALVPFRGRRFRNLRAWHVRGFKAFRIYYILETDLIRVLRILHSARNVRHILEEERA